MRPRLVAFGSETDRSGQRRSRRPLQSGQQYRPSGGAAEESAAGRKTDRTLFRPGKNGCKTGGIRLVSGETWEIALEDSSGRSPRREIQPGTFCTVANSGPLAGRPADAA